MALTLYLDTNVFRHLTDAGESALRDAASTKQILILLSAVNLDELLGALETASEEAVLPRIQRLLRLVDHRRILKDTAMLLTDDIRSYADSGRAAEPVLSGEDLLYASARLGALLLETSENSRIARLSVVHKAKEQKESFLLGMNDRYMDMLHDTEKIRGVSFEYLWHSQSLRTAEYYATRVGVLDDCRRRGIEGLLKIKGVRMAVGTALSYFYAKSLQKQPQAVRIGDSRDLQHAVLAASRADVFVTMDNRLRDLVARVPMDHLRVLAFDDLLKELENRGPITR
jgi:predicted nucleic acid-binding protein